MVTFAILAWFWAWLALPGLLALAFTLWFFRDPERRTPEGAALVISPADGRIIKAGPARISVFMNVFNVHVCRAPVAGEVESADHHDGKFMAAWDDHASEHNERVAIALRDGSVRILFTLVAGLVARRIVCKVKAGQRVAAGERIGLIQFGSRVDVDLPEGSEVAVAIGDRVTAGETVIARRSA